MRILHTNFLRRWGGQSNRVLIEAKGVAELGHEVFISTPPGSELAKRGRAVGMPIYENVIYAGGARPAVLTDIREMRKLLARLKPDIIHLHGGRDSWVTAGALTFRMDSKARIIRTKHNIFPIANHTFNRWQYGKFFERLVVVSHAVRFAMRRKAVHQSG